MGEHADNVLASNLIVAANYLVKPWSNTSPKLVETCEYGTCNLTEEMLRDRIAVGIRYFQMLQFNPEQTLEKACAFEQSCTRLATPAKR